MGFFEKIKNGLKKTRSAMAATLGGLFDSFTGANEEFYEELEESMILADMGVETSCKVVEKLRERFVSVRGGEVGGDDLISASPISGGFHVVFLLSGGRRVPIKRGARRNWLLLFYISLISLLFCHCYPAAIIGRVVSVYVDAVDRKAFFVAVR